MCARTENWSELFFNKKSNKPRYTRTGWALSLIPGKGVYRCPSVCMPSIQSPGSVSREDEKFPKHSRAAHFKLLPTRLAAAGV